MTAVGFFGGLGCAAGLYTSLQQLPDVGSLSHYVPHETSKIFDRSGHLLANVHGEENRVVIPLHDIPKFVQQAVIAMEDTDFYNHYGVDPKGITRALLVNVAEGGSVEEEYRVEYICDRVQTFATTSSGSPSSAPAATITNSIRSRRRITTSSSRSFRISTRRASTRS